jgi:hypothetical protein
MIGVSGMLRRHAFKYSEGKWAHWLTLLVADRVNVIEGIISDIKQGHFPNIIAERGGKAEWKYNRNGYTISDNTSGACVSDVFSPGGDMQPYLHSWRIDFVRYLQYFTKIPEGKNFLRNNAAILR